MRIPNPTRFAAITAIAVSFVAAPIGAAGPKVEAKKTTPATNRPVMERASERVLTPKAQPNADANPNAALERSERRVAPIAPERGANDEAHMRKLDEQEKAFSRRVVQLQNRMAGERKQFERAEQERVKRARAAFDDRIGALGMKTMSNDLPSGIVETNTGGFEMDVVDLATVVYSPRIDNSFGEGLPGSGYVFQGEHFGANPGRVDMRYERWDGVPQFVQLPTFAWGETALGAVIPAALQGYRSQQVTVKITREDGRTVLAQMPLEPIEQVAALTTNDVEVIQCHPDANLNVCGQEVGGLSPVGAIVGYHRNRGGLNGVFSGDDSGRDQFRIELENDWKIHSAQTHLSLTSGDESVGGPFPSALAGLDDWAMSYDWVASQGDRVYYTTLVNVKGPRGVPMR